MFSPSTFHGFQFLCKGFVILLVFLAEKSYVCVSHMSLRTSMKLIGADKEETSEPCLYFGRRLSG